MGGYSATDPTYGGFGSDDDGDDLQRALAKIMSPQPAQSLVPPPPNSPPASDTAQSTPQTGSLAYPPQQAQPKISGPPMLPGIATPPEKLGAGNAPQPASTGTTSGGLRTVIRDLNGKPAGSPLSYLSASRPSFGAQGNQQASSLQPQVGPAPLMAAGIGNGSYNVQPVRPAQSAVSPVQPIRQGVQPIIPPGQPQPVQPQPYRPGDAPGGPASTTYAGLRRRAWTCAICCQNVAGSY